MEEHNDIWWVLPSDFTEDMINAIITSENVLEYKTDNGVTKVKYKNTPTITMTPVSLRFKGEIGDNGNVKYTDFLGVDKIN